MSDSESEERLQRAARLRRTVAETIARVRRTTAHIGLPRPPSGDDAAAPPLEPETPSEPAPQPPRAESPAASGDGGLGHDVSALLERTRSVIERTRRVIEESKASLTHPRRPASTDDPADEEDGEEDGGKT